MFGKKTTGGSFLISIIIHGIAIVILMFYVFRINEKIEKTIEAVFYEPKPIFEFQMPYYIFILEKMGPK